MPYITVAFPWTIHLWFNHIHRSLPVYQLNDTLFCFTGCAFHSNWAALFYVPARRRTSQLVLIGTLFHLISVVTFHSVARFSFPLIIEPLLSASDVTFFSCFAADDVQHLKPKPVSKPDFRVAFITRLYPIAGAAEVAVFALYSSI